MNVKFVDLGKQYDSIKEVVLGNIDHIISNGAFMGAQDFEKTFAKYNEKEFCVGVGSGTDALLLSLLAFGVGRGDEVIVPANTYIATAFAVSHTGARPVFVDPDPETYVMTIKNLDSVLTSNTKAIIPVHLYGHPVNMKEILEFARIHKLLVIGDCAQSAGAKCFDKPIGYWGNANCFSFYPTKNLGGLGQGGAVVLNDADAAKKIRELGNVGRAEGSWFDYLHIGYNSRLDAINAKFLETCLEKLDEWNELRRSIAKLYKELLPKDVLVSPMGNKDIYPVFHLYEIKCQDYTVRNRLKEYLEDVGVGCGLHYPVPCNRQPVYNTRFIDCPVSDELSDTLLSLPMHPYLEENEVKYVCEQINNFFSKLYG